MCCRRARAADQQAIDNWEKLYRHAVRLRWCQLSWWHRGVRLQQMSADFRERLSRFIRPKTQ